MNIAWIIVGIVVAALAGFLYYSYRKMMNAPLVADHDGIKTLTDQDFDRQIKSGVTLVDFWAEWCMPCKMMAPILNEVASELNEGAAVGKINIEDHKQMAARYQVRSIPTLILFKNGNEINRFVGGKSKDFLVREINKVK